jgi:hypothetical protein
MEACLIQIDDVQSPLGHRACEKPMVRTSLTLAARWAAGFHRPQISSFAFAPGHWM